LVNVTLERLIGSWLERIFANRRAREVLVGLFVLSMVSMNFLNPALQKWGGRETQPNILHLIPYFSWLPASLPGNAVDAASNGDFQGLVITFAGLLVWLGATSGLLWLRYKAQYLGEELSESGAPTPAKRGNHRQATTTTLPGFLSPPVAGVMRKEFHYLTRNGFSFITLLLPPVMVVFFSMQFAGNNSMVKEHGLPPQAFFPAAMAYLILILLSPAYNSFAFEGRGIQSYFMAPVRMRDILVGKNLFLVCVVGMELTVSLGVLIWRIGFPRLPAVTFDGCRGRVCGDGTVDDRQLVRAEFSQKNGDRENEGAAEFGSGGVDRLWRADSDRRNRHRRDAGRRVVRETLAAGGGVCRVDRGRARRLPGVAGSAEHSCRTQKELLIETLCR